MKVLASNFKMNHSRGYTKEYINKLDNFLYKNNITDEIFLFIPYTTFDNYNIKSNIIIGAQNGYFEKNGAFTGEIGLAQLDEFNIKSILIGHSERRFILNETNKDILRKYNFYKNNNFKIIFCIGEPLKVRKKGIDETIKYLKNQLTNIDLEYENLTIAYEPVWAIGTGISASISQINQTHAILKEFIKAPILYGGSVKNSNIKDILNIDGVDGVLVGTASWDIDNFIDMINLSNIINYE